MEEAFTRCEGFLDLEISEDPLMKQKDQLHTIIEEATPERETAILVPLTLKKLKDEE